MAKVLLVDDDIAEISSVKRALLRAGHQPALATNASDASSAMAQDLPDLLVVSTTCENGEALALARRLDDDPATAGLPLLLLGDADAIPSGARRLARPLDPEQLLAEVTAALGPPAGIELESPETAPPPPAPPPSAPRPRAAAAGSKPQPARSVPPLVAAADAAAAAAKQAAAGAKKSAAARAAPREAPAGATALASPLPQPGAAGLEEAAASRRAAADALRARAEELRKAGPRPGAVAIANALAPAKPPAAKPGPAKPAAAKPAQARPAADKPAPAKTPKPAPASPPAPILLDPPGDPAPPPPRPTRSSLAQTFGFDDGDFDAAFGNTDAAAEGDGAPANGAEEARRLAADEALRALEEEASTHAAEVARARRAERAASEAQGEAQGEAQEPRFEPEPSAPPSPAARNEAPVAASDERALREAIEAARREAFEAAKRELEERARQEAAEAARLVQAEARARQEAVASAQKEAEALAQQRAEAEERAQAEADARRSAEEQLQRLREQLEEERRKAEERVATVMQRAAQEEEAADELRRLAEDELRRRQEDQDETERARTAEEEKLREAITTARAELEALRRKSEDEARRRAEAEEALQRLEQAQRRAQRDAEQEQARREAAERVEAEREVTELARRPIAPAEPERFATPSFFAPFDGADTSDELDAPSPDPAEDAARRRVAALRAGPAEFTEPGSSIEPIPDPVEAPAPPPDPGRAFPPPPAPLRAGDLAELPIPRLLAMAAKAKLSGRLDFHGEVPRSVWFEGGRVVGASSGDTSDRAEEVALRLGLITREQHRQIAQATATLPSRRAALLLLERGFLKATELTGLVRRRTEEVLFGVFGEERGSFRWIGAEVPPEERTDLERGALALAVEGVRRRWRGARVDALLGGPATLLAPIPNAPGAPELGLSAEERRAVGLADGLRTLDEIVHASPLDPLTTRQVLAALVVTGALAVRVLHAGQPRGGATASIDLARVKDKLEQVRRADYFTVLGVGRLCTPHEVREAADRLQAEFEPRRFAGVADDSLSGRLAEILQVIQDAREVLADDRLREEYLRGLGDAG